MLNILFHTFLWNFSTGNARFWKHRNLVKAIFWHLRFGFIMTNKQVAKTFYHSLWLTSASIWHVLVGESPGGILCLLRTPNGDLRSGIPRGGGKMVVQLLCLMWTILTFSSNTLWMNLSKNWKVDMLFLFCQYSWKQVRLFLTLLMFGGGW